MYNLVVYNETVLFNSTKYKTVIGTIQETNLTIHRSYQRHELHFVIEYVGYGHSIAQWHYRFAIILNFYR